METPKEEMRRSTQSSTSLEEKSPDSWKDFIRLVILSLVIVIPFRLFIAQPFIVDGSSMDPTFETGDYLIVDELSYRFATPERGSILIFKYPIDPKRSFIKRVIGLPGETVSLSKGKVTVFNTEHPDGLKLGESYVKFSKDETADYIIGQNEYFVLGDNRASSADSRVWGLVPKENIIGRPIIRVFPPSTFPGDNSNPPSSENTSG